MSDEPLTSDSAASEAARLQGAFPSRILHVWQIAHAIGSPLAAKYVRLYETEEPFTMAGLPGLCYVRGWDQQLDLGRVVFSLERREP